MAASDQSHLFLDELLVLVLDAQFFGLIAGNFDKEALSILYWELTLFVTLRDFYILTLLSKQLVRSVCL